MFKLNTPNKGPFSISAKNQFAVLKTRIAVLKSGAAVDGFL
jgi:hypothetical protein